ncbi:MAG: adenylosuccinate synthetase, partial [Thaumarchaeota archaeon]|nr:adenylosuccinate synthetase [Nitrososphaerota archaeon]
MPATVVVGGFFGDEGKGKIISHLALNDNPAIAVRGGVGPNAGHTVVYDGRE